MPKETKWDNAPEQPSVRKVLKLFKKKNLLQNVVTEIPNGNSINFNKIQN